MTDRVVELAFGEVIVHAVERSKASGSVPAFATWPCHGCGRTRLLDDAWLLTVTDAPTGANRRQVLVCAGCKVQVEGSAGT